MKKHILFSKCCVGYWDTALETKRDTGKPFHSLLIHKSSNVEKKTVSMHGHNQWINQSKMLWSLTNNLFQNKYKEILLQKRFHPILVLSDFFFLHRPIDSKTFCLCTNEKHINNVYLTVLMWSERFRAQCSPQCKRDRSDRWAVIRWDKKKKRPTKA